MRLRPALFALIVACTPSSGGREATPLGLTDRETMVAVGRTAVVTGEVVQVKRQAHHGFAYLNFGGRYPAQTFAVLIPDSVVARFGDLDRFAGRRVQATGLVWLQDEKWPAMTLTDPAALELLP